mgnify:CR=1 FL=1
MNPFPRKNRNNKGKQKIPSYDSKKESKPNIQNISKIKNIYFPNNLTQKRLSLHSCDNYPSNIYEWDNFSNEKNLFNINEDNYFEIVTKKEKELKKIDDEIDEQYNNNKIILNILDEIEGNKNIENEKCYERINEIYNEENEINKLLEQINELEKKLIKSEEEKKIQNEFFEKNQNNDNKDIINIIKEIDIETNNLKEKQKQNIELKEKIPLIIDSINILEGELNKEKTINLELTKNKDELKEQYDKINKIVLKENKYCHNNFYSLLILFPYLKNVAFISNNKYNPNEIKIENLDENKILMDNIEKVEFEKIKLLLEQKEQSKNNYTFKILNDRRTLQLNNKEKYKFEKIFSIINNNYIAEPWDYTKFFSFKLSTINSYFNEFNMTAISNNYFIIYFIPVLDKTNLNGELFNLFQQLKRNEYIDKNIIIKISAITESNYINIQENNNITNQLNTINSSGNNIIYGFLYEFIKSNRLNKKNIFRIYNFDYSYPQAIDMLTNISKYYAKKKRKKTGVYQKVIKNKSKSKKLNDKNGNNNNKANNKNNNIKIQNKKITNIRNTLLNNNNNNQNIKTIVNNKNDKKKILNVSSLDNKPILKKSGSTHQSPIKEKKFGINSKNNIKCVKFEEDINLRNNSANKDNNLKKAKVNSIVINDLKIIKPEHTLIIHDIDYEFVNNFEFKNIAKACGLLNNEK